MEKGLKVDYGQRIGKTIIFAKNHKHAECILEVFNAQFPNLPGYAMVIDNQMTYAQSAIDEFSDPDEMPQIAISVDMLDTGIDVPEVLNLVFFMGPGKETASTERLQSAIFNLMFEMSFKLQDLDFQTERLKAYRKALVEQMCGKVRELSRENFAVRQHLKYVDQYSSEAGYQGITYEDTLVVREEVAPLILPDADEINALRLDALMYGIELAYLRGKKNRKARTDLKKKATSLAGVANIPEIEEQSDLIDKILHSDYVDQAGINEFEEIRNEAIGRVRPGNRGPRHECGQGGILGVSVRHQLG